MKKILTYNEHVDYTLYNTKMDKPFYGDKGAGILPICKKTGRILVAYRSLEVNEPHTWGIFGGKLDEEDGEEEVDKEFE